MPTSARQAVALRARVARLSLAILALGALYLAQDLAGGWLDTLLLYLPGADKVLHGLESFAIVIFLSWLTGAWWPDTPRRFVVILGIGVGLAALDELQQGFVGTRSVELNDFIADVCGLAIGAAATRAQWRLGLRIGIGALALGVLATLTTDSYLVLRDFNSGQRYERRGEFGRAREAYLKALQSGLDSAALYNSLGWVEVESGEGSADKAVEYAAKALALRPADPDILDTYGWALVNAGRPSEALAPLSEAREKKPRMFCIHYHLGKAYLAVGDRREAETHFRMQLQVSPEADESRRAMLELERLR